MFETRIIPLFLAALGSSACASTAHSAPPAVQVIRAGTLIETHTGKVRQNVTIVVEDNRIKAIKEGSIKAPPGATVIDLSGYTVMPGLMDMHTHLRGEHHAKSYQERFVQNEADFAYKAAANARATLGAGFTTVRDLGDAYNVTVALRRAIASGIADGPRIFTAARSIATTGGHADPTNGWAEMIRGDPGPKHGVVNGPDEARKAVRQRYKDGADLIKITATGGVLSLASSGDNAQFTPDELQAIVQTAKDYGMTVAVHAHGSEGMKRAVMAGVDSIEHGTFMTPEIMDLMKQHGTTYVPTILAGKWVEEKSAIEGFFPEVVRPKAARIGPLIHETFKKAYKAGVTIAFGTDSGVSAHGDNAKEFVYMVEGGMSPMEAIQSATMGGAKLLKQTKDLGSIEPGKFADIIAVKGDPLKNIALLQNVAFVMKDGKVFKGL